MNAERDINEQDDIGNSFEYGETRGARAISAREPRIVLNLWRSGGGF
jgi:hypothetical protein